MRRGIRSLVYPVSLQLMVDEVVLGLATFPANVALWPGVGRRQIRVYVLDVLTQIARRRVATTAVSTHRPEFLVTQGRVQPGEVLYHSRRLLWLR